MTDAERVLRTVHDFGHALLVRGESRLLSFADACDVALPRWLSREIDAHAAELIGHCAPVACAQCGRPSVPVEGLRCAACDAASTGGAGRTYAVA